MKPNWIKQLRLPVIQAPMFLVSNPNLVIASCKAGIVGTFPALNPRTEDQLDNWLREVSTAVGTRPYGVNLIVHKTNVRLDGNLKMIRKHKVSSTLFFTTKSCIFIIISIDFRFL